MTSKIKVDNINKVSDDSNIIKKCGTTTTIGSGASNPIVVDGSTVTLGRCGGTVALASGATQTGFGRTGTVDWQTTIKTSTITAVNGEGYFVNTTAGAITANLPAGVVGAIVSIKDYAQTFATNNCTIAANGSEKIEGLTDDLVLNTDGVAITIVYGDATKGWQSVNSNEVTNAVKYVTATGGTTATCGDFKIHTFTGPGTFAVTCAGTAGGNNQLEYIVIGGGGSGTGGGGGAGGFRFASPSIAPLTYPAKPLAGSTVTASAGNVPITVGAGGAASGQNSGSNSVFSTITSAGGGAGAIRNAAGVAGGSGGGAGQDLNAAGAAGNTPPVSPSQGNNGGPAPAGGFGAGGGGGGALAAGTSGGGPGNPSTGGAGGAGGGFPNAFGTSGESSSPFYYFSGGGGGGPNTTSAAGTASGGLGGGGNSGSSQSTSGSPASANTGGGGGAAEYDNALAPNAAAGGSGIVIIRYKFQN